MPDASSHATFAVERGSPQPLGACPVPGGVNFSLFSMNATGVELLLFVTCDAPEPFQAIRLDPSVNRSFHFWHVCVRGLQAGAHYAYRVDGPFDPTSGHRFNRNKVLIDPYARGSTNAVWKRDAACGPDDNVATSMRSVVIDTTEYDWEGDRPLEHPMEDTVIYEMHVRGFTQSPSSGVQHPGTFLGLIEKIPYLKDVVDCGTVIHPDSAEAQVEGAALWGLSLALYEGTEFVKGQPKDTNLDSYRVLRMGDVPEIEVEFLPSTETPVGLGEPATTPVAPAIANAIFAATGARVRDLPIRPQAVLQALAHGS